MCAGIGVPRAPDSGRDGSTSGGETAEETLARLSSAESGPATLPASVASTALPRPDAGRRFRVVRLREGYEIAQVDAFFHVIASATRQQILDVQFPTTRLREGYDMDVVHTELDVRAAKAPPT